MKIPTLSQGECLLIWRLVVVVAAHALKIAGDWGFGELFNRQELRFKFFWNNPQASDGKYQNISIDEFG